MRQYWHLLHEYMIHCKAICVSPVWVLVIPLPKPYPWNPLTTVQGSPVDPENLLRVFTKDNVRSITRFDHPLFWKTGFIHLHSYLLIWPSQHHQIDLIWTSKSWRPPCCKERWMVSFTFEIYASHISRCKSVSILSDWRPLHSGTLPKLYP